MFPKLSHGYKVQTLLVSESPTLCGALGMPNQSILHLTLESCLKCVAQDITKPKLFHAVLI